MLLVNQSEKLKENCSVSDWLGELADEREEEEQDEEKKWPLFDCWQCIASYYLGYQFKSPPFHIFMDAIKKRIENLFSKKKNSDVYTLYLSPSHLLFPPFFPSCLAICGGALLSSSFSSSCLLTFYVPRNNLGGRHKLTSATAVMAPYSFPYWNASLFQFKLKSNNQEKDAVISIQYRGERKKNVTS